MSASGFDLVTAQTRYVGAAVFFVSHLISNKAYALNFQTENCRAFVGENVGGEKRERGYLHFQRWQ